MSKERHAFISHIQENEEYVPKLRETLERRGLTVDNGSITSDKFNRAQSEEYIKEKILKPRIRWASVLIVLVSEETAGSSWVNWEIEYAAQKDKRIVAVYLPGSETADLPEAAADYADAIVNWDAGRIYDAITGDDSSYAPGGQDRPRQDLVRQARC